MKLAANNIDWASHFLAMLDVAGAPFEFRTFDDKKTRARDNLKRKIYGTFASVRPKLLELNSLGAGVFVVINAGGQKDVQVTSIRAVFADTDGAPLDPIVNALAPHIVVRSSPGNYHVYWLVDSSFPITVFERVQLSIAEKFGTDPAVRNLSRVMRLPGFMHNKGEPSLVTLTHEINDRPRYSFPEIVQGLGLKAPTGTSVAHNSPPGPTAAGTKRMLEDTEAKLRFVNPWCKRDKWMSVIFAIADTFGEDGRDLATRWSRGDLWSGGTNET